MHIYADQLVERIPALLTNGDVLETCELPHPRLGSPWTRYWDQYVRYQRLSRVCQGDVNHIVDHGYAHLVYSLAPERTVVTFHDSAVSRTNGIPLRTRLAFRYSLNGLKRAARVMADSEASRRDLLSEVDYPPERVRVVYLGVDPSFHVAPDRERVRARYGLSGPSVLHVGHTQPYMNLERVLETIQILAGRHGIDVRLVKVGGSFTPEQSALAARLGIRDRITELGHVRFEDLPGLYRAADVLLYPPLSAGFGLPLVEAMASGTPVVCSNRGSLPEIAGDAAIQIDPETPTAMAEQVAVALTDASAREALRRKGLARARRFSWDATARAVLGVYRELGSA